MFYLTKDQLPIFLPLGFVGLYRWFWFLLKIVAYCLYKPLKPRNNPRYKPNRDVTILVPTIDCGGGFKDAVKSWLLSDPFEIIIITTTATKASMEEMIEDLQDEKNRIRVIAVKKANKRCQMVKGVNECKTAISVFADDDVIWPAEMLKWMLAPFEDKQMGGVGI